MGFLTVSATSALAADFPTPPGGWTYIYNGDKLTVGDPDSGWTSLDGTWTHDNGSDAWDGTEIGGTLVTGGGFGMNAPGGASLGTQNGVSYLRMQDTGDPRDYGYGTDPSSRKIYFGHNIGSDIDPAKALTIMRSGVTLTFRARIPTLAKAGPPLDSLHRDGQQAAGVQSYPTNGDGYVTSDGGKGNFVIREGGNGSDVPAAAIAFSFTQTTDTTGGAPSPGQAGFAGLSFNEFSGNLPSANVNFGQGTKTNVVAFDPTEWHELYIVIRDDPADIGTHEAFVFRDGILAPVVFKITGGTGADMSDSFLAMGGSATPQNWALDVDWFGYKDEAVFPPGALLPPSVFALVPANRTMFYPVSGNLSFSSSALMPTNTLPASGIKAILNGQDVSSQLKLSGSDTSKSRTVTFSSLQPNTAYTSTIIVTDSGGLSTTNELTFDTFVAAQAIVLEAEDYNYDSGKYATGSTPNSYAGLGGTANIDFMDMTPSSMGVYREIDPVDIQAGTDLPRQIITAAGATDYQVGLISQGEWWNYTRSFTAGKYYIYLRCSSTKLQDVRVDKIVGDATRASQITQFLGGMQVPRTGNLNLFDYAALKDVKGNPIPVSLSGIQTLRFTALNAADDLVLNYIILAPAAALSEPALTVYPAPNVASVLPGFSVDASLFDAANPIDKATVKLILDGTEVNATITKTGDIIQVRYTPSTILMPNTKHMANLSYNDGVARSFDWSFTMADYRVLTPAMKVKDARTTGFVWKVFQNEAAQDTTNQRAEDALAGKLKASDGQLLPNLADPNASGVAIAAGTPVNPGNKPITFRISSVINLSQNVDSNFGTFVPDEQMPGIPGISGSTDGIAAEIITFLELPAGLVTMGVNSDDGFLTTAGFLNESPLVLAEVNAGRSATDTIFQFVVIESGVYAFRTLWEEGGGDASIEWFTVKADGSKVLVNNTANGGVRAYQEGTVPNKPAADVKLTIQYVAGGKAALEWPQGILQSADVVTGPYQDVSGAQSPYSLSIDKTQKFFRIKVQ